MEEKFIKVQLGQAVKKFRLSQNISQEKLAEIVDLHRTYISMVERGERNISLINIVRIAEGLGIKTSEIFLEMEKEK